MLHRHFYVQLWFDSVYWDFRFVECIVVVLNWQIGAQNIRRARALNDSKTFIQVVCRNVFQMH